MMRYYSMAIKLLLKKKKYTLCYLLSLTITVILMLLFGNLLTHPYFILDGTETIQREIVLSLSMVFLCALIVNYYIYLLFIHFQRENLTVFSLCGATNYQLRSIVKKQMILLYFLSIVIALLLSKTIWQIFYDYFMRNILNLDLQINQMNITVILSLILSTGSTFIFAVLVNVSQVENLPVNYLTINEPYSTILTKESGRQFRMLPIWIVLFIISVISINQKIELFLFMSIVMLISSKQINYYFLSAVFKKYIHKLRRSSCLLIAISFTVFEMRKSVIWTTMTMLATAIFAYLIMYLESTYYKLIVLLFLLNFVIIVLGNIISYIIDMRIKAESLSRLIYSGISEEILVRAIKTEIVLFFGMWIFIPLIFMIIIMTRVGLGQIFSIQLFIFIFIVMLLVVIFAIIQSYFFYKNQLIAKFKEIKDE